MILAPAATPPAGRGHRQPLAPPTRPIALVLAALASLALPLGACGGDDPSDSSEPTFSYVIPAGAGVDIQHGKPLDILPEELIAQLDETIVIVNNDDQAHLLGPWFVGPGETLRQRFTEAGVFDGDCSVHASGEFTVIVEG